MREIVFDTETTGLNPDFDRIIDIGCVELVNHIPTGKTYQCYINPERAMSEEVIAVHGLTEEFLSDKPKFEQIADDFLDFIGEDSILIAHNAVGFDMKFINAELSRCHRAVIPSDRVLDTLLMARKMFPGSRVNLDELCKRFRIDNSSRTKHGALLDSELLAEVYLELIGGREPDFLSEKTKTKSENKPVSAVSVNLKADNLAFHEPRPFPVSPEEEEQHKEFIRRIKNNLWGIE